MSEIEDKLYHYKATVSKITDGDTIKFDEINLGFNVVLKNQVARLIGIDTPELRSKVPEEKKLAYEAKDYLEKRLLGKTVIIKSREFKFNDSFGRILADIYLEDELINDTLLAEGYAVVFMEDK